MTSHSNQVQGPAHYAMHPPNIKLARKASIREARQNQPLRVMNNNLARELFPPEVNRRLEFPIQ